MWTQLIQPTLPGKGTVGNCLQYVRERYGLRALYDPAWSGWLGAKYKHTDRNFPAVYVPVWFKYKLPASSPGHVVIRTPEGKFYSSPYSKTQTNGYVIFNSVEEIEKTLKAGFVGWSEDINNVRVAKQGEDTVKINEGDRANFNNYLYGTDLGYHTDIVGMEMKEGIYHLFESQSFADAQRVNDGDVGNLVDSGITQEAAKKSKGKIWKSAVYQDLMPVWNSGESNFKKLDQDVYVKEG